MDRFHAEQAATGARLPIVIYLHGRGGRTAEALSPRYDLVFAAVPGMEPALIVDPQGANRTWDSVPGRIQTSQRLSGLDGTPVDDIGFLRALVTELVEHEGGDPARVYIADMSAGGSDPCLVCCLLLLLVRRVGQAAIP